MDDSKKTQKKGETKPMSNLERKFMKKLDRMLTVITYLKG